MPRGNHCAVYGCSNDRRFPDRQVIKPHVGVLRFYSPQTPKEISINGKNYSVGNA